MPTRLEFGLLWQLYNALNEGDIEAALAVLHHDVVWINDTSSGLRGHDALRSHWLEEWARIKSILEPLDCCETNEGLSVAVHQVVWNLNSNLVNDRYFHHVHTFVAGLIHKVEVHPWPSASSEGPNSELN